MTVSLTPREVRSWTRAVLLSMVCLQGLAAQHPAVDGKAWDLTPLEPAPDWSRLDAFQQTITHTEFRSELEQVFLSSPADAQGLIQVLPSHALITRQSRRPGETYRLEFASAEAPASLPALPWRPASRLPSLSTPEKPLQDLRILVDPGHIGGEWAHMERRSFVIPSPPPPAPESPAANSPPPSPTPVREGDIVLRVAELLEEKLTSLGARVALVRRRLEPVTPLRPADLLPGVREALGLPDSATPESHRALRDDSERLFYLSAEIRARGERVNEEFRPDLALCLHLNAEDWSPPAGPSLVEHNHFHLLINGSYTRSELMKDDQRFFLLSRILERIHLEELGLAESMAATMAPRLGLPPYEYRGNRAKRPGTNPYVWSRNLLATRIYRCPVVYFEPYVMNHRVTYARIQAGEYQGIRSILGTGYPSLYEEYASAVAAGMAAYYSRTRTLRKTP